MILKPLTIVILLLAKGQSPLELQRLKNVQSVSIGMHMHECNEVTLVWRSFRLAPNIYGSV